MSLPRSDPCKPSSASRFSNWVAVLLVCLLIGNHLLMTATYLSPPNLLRLYFQNFSNRYMSLLFYQNWHLFSPEPSITSTKLAIRCRDELNGWSPWGDPLEDLFTKHYHNRLSGYGKLMYVYRGIATDLHRAYQQLKVETTKFADYDFQIVPAFPSAALPTNGQRTVFLARTETGLQVRIFNQQGQQVVSLSEADKTFDLRPLNKSLAHLWEKPALTTAAKTNALLAVRAFFSDHVVDLLKNTPENQLAFRYAKLASVDKTSLAITDLQWKILEFYPLKYSERGATNRRWSRVTEIIFPSRPVKDDSR